MRNFLRGFMQGLTAGGIMALGALWAFIVIYAYVHLLWSGASYLYHWMFN